MGAERDMKREIQGRHSWGAGVDLLKIEEVPIVLMPKSPLDPLGYPPPSSHHSSLLICHPPLVPVTWTSGIEVAFAVLVTGKLWVYGVGVCNQGCDRDTGMAMGWAARNLAFLGSGRVHRRRGERRPVGGCSASGSLVMATHGPSVYGRVEG